MNNYSDTDWTQQKERVSSFWLKLIFHIALKLPRGAVKWLLHPIVFFYLLISSKQITSSRHYLNQALGRNASLKDVYLHFLWFATTILDRVYFLTGRKSVFNLTYDCSGVWEAMIDNHQPQLFLGAHFGSFDAARFLPLEVHDVKIKAVMKVDQNAMIVELLNELNPQFKSGVIPNNGMETIFKIHETLESGSSVAILKDRPLGKEKTVKVRFFQDTIAIPISGFKLAKTRGVPVNIFFGRYEGKNHYHLVVHQLKFKKDMTIEEMAQLYISEVEKQCQISPYNWFNFYQYWLTNE